MAFTSPVQSPSPSGDTPAPVALYRVPTAAVATWQPPAIDTAAHAVIRARIEPNRGWWQFPLSDLGKQLRRVPWQVSLALGVYSAVVGLGVVGIMFAAYFGAGR